MTRIATSICWAFLLLVSLALSAASVFCQDKSSHTATIRARSGDTLQKIADREGIALAELEQLNRIPPHARLRKGHRVWLPAETAPPKPDAKIVGNRIILADGYTFEAEQVWKEGDEIWYRRSGISKRLGGTVRSITPIVENNAAKPAETQAPNLVAATEKPVELPIWIYLNGGARMRVDEVNESDDGAWYRRGNLTMFLERDRIARIEREQPELNGGQWQQRGWTSGSNSIDELIKLNGARYGVDPYLVFCVIEQESQFKMYAVSPKGARGLMQLMPGTARRLGVKRPFDPAENIMGGTRYLKELMTMFGGQVELVLASYNAGEGAVLKYGRTVPPYRETRDYVRKISRKYGVQQPSQNSQSTSNQRPVQ